MLRSWSLCGASVALLLGACGDVKGVEVDTRLLIPSEANVVVGFELEALRSSAVGPMISAVAQTDPELKAVIDSAPSCAIDLTNLKITFAGAMDQDDQFMAVVRAPGIGKESVVRCLEEAQAKAAGRTAPWMLRFETRGDVRKIDQEGGGSLVILNKDTLVMMEEAWETKVFDAIEKPETRSSSELVKAALAIDPATDAWLAMVVNDAMRTDLAEVKGADGLLSTTATVDFSSGVKISLGLVARDDAKAAELKETVDGMLPLLTAGLPESIQKSARTSVEGSQAKIQVEVAAADVGGLFTALAPMFAGQ